MGLLEGKNQLVIRQRERSLSEFTLHPDVLSGKFYKKQIKYHSLSFEMYLFWVHYEQEYHLKNHFCLLSKRLGQRSSPCFSSGHSQFSVKTVGDPSEA